MTTVELLFRDVRSGEVVSVEYNGGYSLLEAAEWEYTDYNRELLEIESLSMYLDPKVLNEYEVEIINDYEIMNTSIDDLVNGGKLYEILKNKYGL